MDFREYEILREGDELVVVGTIRDPVNWDFTIRLCEDDVPGLTRFAFRKVMIGMLLRGFFKRRRRHHWNQEITEHLSAGRARLEALKEKARERARAAVDVPDPRRLRPAGAEVQTPAEAKRTAVGGG
jgi:hypothetical protein